MAGGWAVPDFSPIGRGLADLGAGFGKAKQARLETETEWQKEQRKRQEESLNKAIEAGTLGKQGVQQAETLFGAGGGERAQKISDQNKAKNEQKGLEAQFTAGTAGLTLANNLMKTAQELSDPNKYPDGSGAEQAEAIWGKVKTIFGKIGVECNVSRFQDATTNKFEMEKSTTASIKTGMDKLASDPKTRTPKTLGMTRVNVNNAGRSYGRDKFTGFLDTLKGWDAELAAPWKAKTKPEALELKRAGATRLNLGDITSRREATMKVDIKSPKFRSDVISAVKAVDRDFNYKPPNQKKLAIRQEADKRIKGMYPEAVFDLRKNVLGWYDGDKLIRAWKD